MPVSHPGQKYSASLGWRLASELTWALNAASVVWSTCFSTWRRYLCSTLFLLDLCVTDTKDARGPPTPGGGAVSTSMAVVDECSLMKGMVSSRYCISRSLMSCSWRQISRTASGSPAAACRLRSRASASCLNSVIRAVNRLSRVPAITKV